MPVTQINARLRLNAGGGGGGGAVTVAGITDAGAEGRLALLTTTQAELTALLAEATLVDKGLMASYVLQTIYNLGSVAQWNSVEAGDVNGLDTIAISGSPWKAPVRVATIYPGSLASFVPGASVDGINLLAGDRILIKSQGTGSENGIYVIQASGPPIRDTDADNGAKLLNAAVFASQGAAGHDRAYVCMADAPIVVGTTALTWTDLASAIGAATNAYVDAGDNAVVAQLANYQPINTANLSAIAALTTTAYGRALLALTNQAALLALLPNTGAAAGRVLLPVHINTVPMSGGTTASMATIVAGTYKEIRILVRTAGGMKSGAFPSGAIGVRFNGDSGANYDSQCFYAGGSNSQIGISALQVALTGSTTNVNTVRIDLAVLPLVTSSLPRSIKGIFWSQDAGGGGMISGTCGGYWNNTASGLTDIQVVFGLGATGSVEFSGVPA